jgi:hypothetical protein
MELALPRKNGGVVYLAVLRIISWLPIHVSTSTTSEVVVWLWQFPRATVLRRRSVKSAVKYLPQMSLGNDTMARKY